jgi:hypothetical protein
LLEDGGVDADLEGETTSSAAPRRP